MGLVPGLSFLEVGCGPGAVLQRLRTDFKPVSAVGVELAWESVQRAAKVAPALRADGAKLPFASDSFDAVMLRFVLRHVRQPDQLLAEAMRVVRPGGRVFVLDADESTLVLDPAAEGWSQLHHALEESARRRGGDPQVGRKLKRLLLEAGLVDPRTMVVPVTTDDIIPPMFIETFLAPSARPVDRDLLDTDAASAWGCVRAWTTRPDAFACALGFFASAAKGSSFNK
jgi:SAM-dependent methyltransferase